VLLSGQKWGKGEETRGKENKFFKVIATHLYTGDEIGIEASTSRMGGLKAERMQCGYKAVGLSVVVDFFHGIFKFR